MSSTLIDWLCIFSGSCQVAQWLKKKEKNVNLPVNINEMEVSFHFICNSNIGVAGDVGSSSGLGRSSRGETVPTPVLLPEKSHGQRSLVGYSPKGHKELDTTEGLKRHTFIFSSSE